jgi:hypothetical protein
MSDRRTWTACAASIVLGLALWITAAGLGKRAEPWDAPGYWTVAYPIAIGLSGLLGYLFPERAWRWAALLMLLQLVVMFLAGSDFGLLPLGLILMAVLTLPAAALASLCVRVRGARVRAPR